jgi:Xaa-Pro aminopeptidase
MFETEIYRSRRTTLINRLKADSQTGVALLLGNDESPMSYTDNPYPFRQDSSFLYYFGIDRPGLAAILDLDDGREVLFGDDLTLDDIVWMGNRPTLAELGERVAVAEAATASELATVVGMARHAGRQVHYLPPYRSENVLRLFELLGVEPALARNGASEALTRAVIAQRSIKSEQEIAELDRAVSLTCEMHLHAMRMARPGMVEQEIVAAIQEVAERAGGRIAFPSIVTINGQTLHNHYHGHTLESGRLLLNDSGAETPMRYAGDMSRTFPVDPTFTTRQREIYQVALDAHETAIAALAPGVPFRDVHFTACRTIAAGLGELGLMKGDPAEAVEVGAHALFFQCGTGHMLGLDVHDMEDLGEDLVGYGDGVERSELFGAKSLRLARPLEAGYVLTVEPGIYFIPELIDRWRAEARFADFVDYERVDGYRDFGGLRSEENLVITEGGSKLLGPPIAKTIDEVESIRSAG